MKLTTGLDIIKANLKEKINLRVVEKLK